MATPAGWYHATGDPVGSTRYWNGTQWQGDPVLNPPAADALAAITPQHRAARPPGADDPATQGAGSGDGVVPGSGTHNSAAQHESAHDASLRQAAQNSAAHNYGFQRGPQQELRLASAGSRVVARLIDMVIGLVILAIVAAPLVTGIIDDVDALGPSPTDAQIEEVITDAVTEALSGRLAVFGVVAVFWDFLWVALFGGTPGKLILGLRVATNDTLQRPPGWGRAALRSLNRVVGLVPILGGLVTSLVALASLVMLFVDDQRRTVMDRIGKTVVVKK